MKNETKKQSKKPRNGNGRAASEVRLEFTNPEAVKVCLAGTFNDWRPEATPMIRLADGRWIKKLSLPPGSCEYRLVVDGDWMPDPLAGETAPNPFGGRNSVLNVLPQVA